MSLTGTDRGEFTPRSLSYDMKLPQPRCAKYGSDMPPARISNIDDLDVSAWLAATFDNVDDDGEAVHNLTAR